MKQKVAVGLSGGVDSSVAAAILIEQGYEVHGIYLECYNEPGCRTDQDKADALKVALKLGITFEVLDFRREYKEKVVEYFYAEYEAGRTPNPDVMCNREIKFGIFYDWAIEHGYDYVATGHYARISGENLQRAHDESKDQSYFLWQIPKDHLKHILFPLGGMLKSEVRSKAKAMNLVTATKPDSMGICFIGEVNVNELLKKRLGEKMGDVVMDFKGETLKVGSHRGHWFYTIGERGGFEVDKKVLKTMGLHPEKMGPLYVIGKDKVLNKLIVGSREKTMMSTFGVTGCDIDSEVPRTFVRIRNLGELVEVTEFDGEHVKTKEPMFGVAEGQSAVFYNENGVLVGGGLIV